MSAELWCDVLSVRIRSGLSDTCPFSRQTGSHPPPHADQIAGRRGLVLDLLAQRNDVVVDHAIGHGNPRTPDLVEKAFAREKGGAVAQAYRELCQVSSKDTWRIGDSKPNSFVACSINSGLILSHLLAGGSKFLSTQRS
jgi:hypothetical protein